MITCKNKNCPYQENNECMRRVTVINEFGLCSFLFRGQQLRQPHDKDWKFIKKGDQAVFDEGNVQTNSKDPVNGDAAFKNE